MKKSLPLSYLEISKGNLIYNIKQFRGVINKKTKISCVVKSNAYGHGDTIVVKALDSYVDYFQVNSVEELTRIRKYTKKEIFVFGYVGKSDLIQAIKMKGTLGVFDLEQALLVNQVARKMSKKCKVHIAVDSHLGREGIMPETTELFISEIKKMKNLIVEGVYSHFANIEDTTDFTHAQKQINTYAQTVETFKSNFQNIKTHISATSGVLAYEKDGGVNDIVRIGIGTYGMWPSVELEEKWKNQITLKPVLKWVTHIAQVKVLPKGHSVGYGLSYITNKETVISLVPQGYADGLTRTLSNNGQVLIGGQYVPILGRVAMNMFVVDVSGIANVASGDEVVILGAQGQEVITAEQLAAQMSTINYEVTTHISALLPRLIK